jgi:pyruvate kinase
MAPVKVRPPQQSRKTNMTARTAAIPPRPRNTKIVATLGPASSSFEQIEALFLAGADIFRLNFSHGSIEDHRGRVTAIRRLEAQHDRPIGIVADLQGPKLRIGRFAEGRVFLEVGRGFRLDSSPTPGDATRVQLPHKELIRALGPGAAILLDDGRVTLEVTGKGPDYLDTTVVSGRALSDRKGVNVPGVALPLTALTAKDRGDLAAALDFGVDWIALSFVQRPDDVAEARRLVDGRAAIIVKLEKPQALDHLDALIEAADGVMVARGDLGVELPPEEVPVAQRRIITAVRKAGKPVIVATQMLESMVTAPTPTRAEASDVATAVYEGADAVMLSAETASGAYPVEAVAIMDRIAARVERDPTYRRIIESEPPSPEPTSGDAITAAAHQVARTIGAAAIVTYTSSGSTTLRAARERPAMPILCLTASPVIARRMTLSYGVAAIVTPDIHTFGQMVERAGRMALAAGAAQPGQRLVVTAGVPFGTPGSTNALRITWVE